MDSAQLALANLTSVPVLAFLLGVALVLMRSQLQVPSQIFEFLSMYLLLAIGLKGGVALSSTPASEVWLPILVSVFVGGLIPVVVFFSLKVLTPLDKINRGAIAAHYGSTSLVTFTAGLVFLESSGLKVEGYMPSLLAVMEVPGIIIGILLAKKGVAKGSLSGALNEVFTSKSVVLLLGGIVIGLATGPAGYSKVEPFFGGIFSGMLAIFLLQLGIQAGRSLQEVRTAGFGLLGFAAVFPLLAGMAGVWLAQSIDISQGGSVVFGLLCASASYIAAPAAVRLSLPEAKPGLYITTSLGITFPINLFIGIPLLTWFSGLLS
ncbi:MAG: hypothetical protein RLZZ258_923 [Actinomycetota bacterium]